jgi:hypothetical protein
MQKWEHLVVEIDGSIKGNPEVFSVNGLHVDEKNSKSFFTYIKELGELGWELVKRPKDSD